MITPQFIESQGPLIFQYYDKDRSQSIETHEMPKLVGDVFSYLQTPAPTEPEVMQAIQFVDQNRDGRLAFPEFRAILNYLAGR